MVKQNLEGKEQDLNVTLAACCNDLDIKLTEGFKRSSMPICDFIVERFLS